MSSLRRAISSRLPKNMQGVAQRLAREFDCLRGQPFVGQQPAVVLMFHVGRSGSTVLGDFLHNRPDMFWDGELYHRANTNYRGKLAGINWAKWTKRQFQVARRSMYGYELKVLQDQHLTWLDMNLEQYLEMAEKIGVTHYILLKRQNSLRRMISQHVGTVSGVRHIAKSKDQKVTSVHLDVDNFSVGGEDNKTVKSLYAFLKDVDDVYAYIEKRFADAPFLTLTYEDDILAQGPQVGYNKICDFLSLDRIESSSELKRTNPYSVRDMVSNFDDLQAHLGDTEFAWMLDD